MELILYAIIAIFALSLGYLIYRHIVLIRKFQDIKRELNSQSLDYHLKRITELGYDFTLKAGKDLPKKKEKKPKNKKTKQIDDILDE